MRSMALAMNAVAVAEEPFRNRSHPQFPRLCAALFRDGVSLVYSRAVRKVTTEVLRRQLEQFLSLTMEMYSLMKQNEVSNSRDV